MIKRMKEKSENNSRLLDVNELRGYTNLGRNRAVELGTQAGARVKYGKRVLFDRVKLDSYIETLSE